MILEAVTAYTPDNYPVGRITFDGMNLYMNLEEFETHSREEGLAEAHRNYIDVMYIVEGAETIYVKPTDKLQNVKKEYNPERDILQDHPVRGVGIEQIMTRQLYHHITLAFCFHRSQA